MPKSDLPPTKSNLRRVKADLTFAYEGFDLLEQKREILVMEIVKKINRIKILEEHFRNTLENVYQSYRKAAAAMGSSMIMIKSCSEKPHFSVEVEYTRIMGSDFPVISTLKKPFTKNAVMHDTISQYDSTKKLVLEMISVIGEYATLIKAIYILSRELKKVQRRVNALEKIFIPQYEETKKFIGDRLEELEREELFIKKMIGRRSV